MEEDSVKVYEYEHQGNDNFVSHFNLKLTNLKNAVTFTKAYKYNVIIKTDEEIYIRFNTKR